MVAMTSGIAGAFMAWVFMLWTLLILAKTVPRLARAVKPGLTTIGRSVTIVARPLRLPVLCTMALVVAIGISIVAGSLYGYAKAYREPRTCALIPFVGGGYVPTCEIGHDYHDKLVQLGQT